jgi:N utilization substance protein B
VAGPVADYTGVLVRGVSEHQARIDELLATYAEGWTLARMPVRRPQRAPARGVRGAVRRRRARRGRVSEALQLVRDLSTDDSPGFVNGVWATSSATRRR